VKMRDQSESEAERADLTGERLCNCCHTTPARDRHKGHDHRKLQDNEQLKQMGGRALVRVVRLPARGNHDEHDCTGGKRHDDRSYGADAANRGAMHSWPTSELLRARCGDAVSGRGVR